MLASLTHTIQLYLVYFVTVYLLIEFSLLMLYTWEEPADIPKHGPSVVAEFSIIN